MSEPLTINTCTFNTWKAALCFFVFMAGGVFSSVILVSYFGWPEITLWVGFFIFFIFPLLFIGQLKKIFIKKAVIKLNNDNFSIELFNRKTEVIETQYEYMFKDIKSFKTAESARDGSSVLKLNFIDGTKVSYTFLKQKNEDSNITKNIWNFIRSYNNSHLGDRKMTSSRKTSPV